MHLKKHLMIFIKIKNKELKKKNKKRKNKKERIKIIILQ